MMMISTSSSKTLILLFHLLLYTGCSSDNSGAKRCSGEECFTYLRQRHEVRERCTQKCSAENNQVEVSSCTSEHNRVCHCKPGFFCTSENNYKTYCHKPCVPCVPGTFSSGPSLNSACTPHTDCAKSGLIVLKDGSGTQDRECDQAKIIPKAMAAPTPTTIPTPSKIISTLSPTTTTTPSTTDSITINSMTDLFIPVKTSNSLPPLHSSTEASPTHRLYSQSDTGTTSARTAQGGNVQKQDSDSLSRESLLLFMLLMILMLVVSVFCIWKKSTALKSISKWTGFMSGKHEEPEWRKCQDAFRILSNSQSKTSEQIQSMELNQCSEVTGQNMGVTSQSGGGQKVNMEHNVKGENVSNTVGTIYIYSPGTVILGSNSGDKKEDAGVCEEVVPLISPPQQESNPPLQEVRITMSAQEEEATLSFPVPATGK